jgi:hypothetical protein
MASALKLAGNEPQARACHVLVEARVEHLHEQGVPLRDERQDHILTGEHPRGHPPAGPKDPRRHRRGLKLRTLTTSFA